MRMRRTSLHPSADRTGPETLVWSLQSKASMIAPQSQLLTSSSRPVRAATPAGNREGLLRFPGAEDAWESHAPAPDLSTLTLRFSVSRNEEYVALTARDAHRTIDLGARAHHLVLLALARSRLADRQARSASPGDLQAPRSDSSDGWIYLDELATQLAMDEPHLNVAVFRGRRQLAQAGILGAAGIVERRRLTRELRLGVARLELETV
jgi:hypothetical protein